MAMLSLFDSEKLPGDQTPPVTAEPPPTQGPAVGTTTKQTDDDAIKESPPSSEKQAVCILKAKCSWLLS